MLLLLTLLLCFPLQGSVSATQNVQGQLISRLERVGRGVRLSTDAGEEPAAAAGDSAARAERYYYPELGLSRELQRYTYELCKGICGGPRAAFGDDVA